MATHPLDYVPSSFWELVVLAQQNQEQFTDSLRQMSREDLLAFISTFEEATAEFKYEPYTDYASQSLSEDGIDDLAQWVVEQGKAYTYQIFDNPSQIPQRVDHPIGFLSKAVRTFYQRFGGPIPLKP